jgi:ribonuclease BN (tRNA processing enzyme)
VEAGEQMVLLDCGPGVLSNLQQVASVFALNAVIITHLHPDHVLDLFALKQALEFGRFPERAPPLRLFGPPGAYEALPAWMDASDAASFRERFQFFPIRGGTAARLGPLVLRFAETAHSLPCFALRVEGEGGTLTYSADTGPSAAVAALAEGADLFLCENTLPPGEEGRAGLTGHLSAAQAGQMAAGADVRRLLLTHFFAPAGDYAEEAERAAAKEFGGQVLIARELERHDI